MTNRVHVSGASVVRKLPELSRSRGDVLLLRSVGHSVAQRKTLVEALHYQVPTGKLLLLLILVVIVIIM